MTQSTSPFGALAGKRVIDLSRVLGGPYCTQILADHGAEVIKIEPPKGDETRDWGPPFHEGDSAYFIGINRNKRSIGIDLTSEEGRMVLMRMLEGADILVENFKPGTMEKWGLGYDDVLKQKFPQLIHCRISGFGADGPLGGFPGYDAIIQAMAGWFSVNGEPGSQPTRMGLAMVDMGTGLYSTIAILMALSEREQSGYGQYLDMTLFDCAVSLMHPHIANYNFSGKVPGPTGNAHPNISPYDTFRTGTVDIFIGAGKKCALAKLCNELDRPEMVVDERFTDNIDRVNNRIDLTEELESTLAGMDGNEVYQRLLNAGLASGPIYNTEEVVNHPHTRHRQMSIEKDWYKMAGTPIKMSRTPGAIHALPPKYGEHCREILQQFGFSEAEISELIEHSAVLEKRK